MIYLEIWRDAKLIWNTYEQRSAGISSTVISRSFIVANVNYSRVAQYEAKMQGLRTENSRYAQLSCSSLDANVAYSRVAQCEAEMEALRTENNRYFCGCTSVLVHIS